MDDLTHDEQHEHPPLEADQPTADVETTAPLDEGTSDQDEPRFTERTLDDLDPDARELAELRLKQLQGDYTRKTQELAEERRAFQAELELIQGLRDEETREEALLRLAETFDLELVTDEDEDDDDDDDEVYDDDEGPESYDAIEDPEVSALRERVDRWEADQAAQQEAVARQIYEQRLTEHLTRELGSWAESKGLALDTLPAHVTQGIVGRLAAMQPGADGMPDVQAAIAAHEAHEAEVVEAYLKSKRAVTPDLSGQTGAPLVDLSDDKARRKAMEAIAERAIARHA